MYWKTRIAPILLACTPLVCAVFVFTVFVFTVFVFTVFVFTVFVFTVFVCPVAAYADGTAAALYKTGTLTVDISGTEVSMQLRLPMTRGDTSGGSKQPLTSTEVVARLKEATKLFVFPGQAKCQVENANAFAVDTQSKPTTAEGNIQAMYRFRCDGATSARIDKLGIRLSDQLPGLEKIKLQLATDKGEIVQELSPANGDVTF